MVPDRIPDRKVANIAASLVAAAASANGSIDEKERELNEVITGLQILREELIRRVSGLHYISHGINEEEKNESFLKHIHAQLKRQTALFSECLEFSPFSHHQSHS